MSFVPLERVDFSREESNLQDTPVRLRAVTRCKSPVPPSEHSAPTPARQAGSMNGSRVQPTPARQGSIPRHTRPSSDVLHVINDSVNDLYDELQNRSTSGQAVADDRISDICRKLDVIATVVLRHQQQLREQSQLLRDSSSRPRSAVHRDESGELIDSIMQRVQDVDAITAQLRNASDKRRDVDTSRVTADVAVPLYRIAEALDSVTKEVQRQHVTIDRLLTAQMQRDEEDRVNSVMALRPPSAIESESEVDAYQSASRFRDRMQAAAEEADAYDDSVTIEPNEASPRRARVVESNTSEAQYYEDSFGHNVEGDVDPSPRRARVDTERRSRDASRHMPTPSLHGATVASKAVANTPLMRTTTKQPEYLLRSATASKSRSSRKPTVRADIFDNSTDSSAQSPARLDDTRSDVGSRTSQADSVIRRLVAENESLKDQLYRQLVKNEDLRLTAEAYVSTPRGRARQSTSVFSAVY